MNNDGYVLGKLTALQITVYALLKNHPEEEAIREQLSAGFSEVAGIMASVDNAGKFSEGWNEVVQMLQGGGLPVVGAVP
jgi:hypothetical protein